MNPFLGNLVISSVRQASAVISTVRRSLPDLPFWICGSDE